MKHIKRILLTVETRVEAPIEVVWKCWTTPADIILWNNASEDWHTTQASNDLQEGGSFSYRMEAKDGSVGFDFEGIYRTIILHKQIDYIIADGRKVSISFSAVGNSNTFISEAFEAENVHPAGMQQKGWQSILDNFKRYVENKIK